MSSTLRSLIKNETEIAAMREGGHMLAYVLEVLRQTVQPGKTPIDMANLARVELKKLGGQPAFLGFQGYPNVICISVNNQVQHSIPSTEPFVNGDVINFDFGVLHKGMITDGGITVCVGEPSPDAARLIKGTKEALDNSLKVIKDGVRVGEISQCVEKTLRRYSLGIVRELVGHGVGHELHEDPEIPNYGVKDSGMLLKAGMTICVEPISTLGGHEIITDRDGWTLWTADGSWSAQFEHTILVTTDGCEVLTSL